jgi:ubiquinone biosynthesis protein UbiJ
LVTPAGLLDVAAPDAEADLTLVITEESPLVIAQGLMQGGKPAVRIEGDVQLAAEVSWLIDHVRWDLEEDMARLLGDAPAHALMQAVRAMAQAVQQFVGRSRTGGSDGTSA